MSQSLADRHGAGNRAAAATGVKAVDLPDPWRKMSPRVQLESALMPFRL